MQKTSVPVLTVDSLPGRNFQYLGCVTASSCLSKSFVQDLSSNLKNWTIGGELNQYRAMIDQSVALVMERIAEEAGKIGADMVLGFKLSTTSVSSGAAEVIGYGTAVKLEKQKSAAD
ncbi:heavy metal-binding domain-containing protein [Aminivibrio sp.]|jgi:uncharacterized protein YbjQ (UPF0145 family)|uniref:YbjQ family protein n=1 Tax=Aminivibrio sp. TaxID=1872489 RepID=UPI001A3E8E3E|nr:heavy metal-binding domain-containing protein [Aminivibrio sp.]MBL3538478.1 heavy metal-binding domain-containing protein [Aminivibrio sp.]